MFPMPRLWSLWQMWDSWIASWPSAHQDHWSSGKNFLFSKKRKISISYLYFSLHHSKLWEIFLAGDQKFHIGAVNTMVVTTTSKITMDGMLGVLQVLTLKSIRNHPENARRRLRNLKPKNSVHTNFIWIRQSKLPPHFKRHIQNFCLTWATQLLHF